MDSDMRGALSEHLFFEAFWKGQRSDCPPWFCGVLPSDSKLDMEGVDAIAWVLVSGERIPIPVQIKSSKKGADGHYARRPAHWMQRVAIVISNEHRRAADIRAQLFEQLEHVVVNGYDYTSFFKFVLKMRIKKKRLIKYRAQREEREKRSEMNEWNS